MPVPFIYDALVKMTLKKYGSVEEYIRAFKYKMMELRAHEDRPPSYLLCIAFWNGLPESYEAALEPFKENVFRETSKNQRYPVDFFELFAITMKTDALLRRNLTGKRSSSDVIINKFGEPIECFACGGNHFMSDCQSNPAKR